MCYVNISFYAYRICYDSLTFHFVGNLKMFLAAICHEYIFGYFFCSFFLLSSHFFLASNKRIKFQISLHKRLKKKKRKFVCLKGFQVSSVHLFLKKLYCYATYLPPYDSRNYFVLLILRSFSFLCLFFLFFYFGCKS